MHYLINNKYLYKGLVFSLFSFFLFTGCEIEQTREGELPDVDVSVEEGQLPEYDIDVMDVDVSMTEKTVTIPKVVVVSEEVEVKVPVVDINMPGKDKEEMTFTVEVEVVGEGHEINIEEVYLVDGEFWVISELEHNTNPETNARTRVSDRIVVNAPGEFGVRHFIIGDKPAGTLNNQYRFINSRSEIEDALTKGQEIYG